MKKTPLKELFVDVEDKYLVGKVNQKKYFDDFNLEDDEEIFFLHIKHTTHDTLGEKIMFPVEDTTLNLVRQDNQKLYPFTFTKFVAKVEKDQRTAFIILKPQWM